MKKGYVIAAAACFAAAAVVGFIAWQGTRLKTPTVYSAPSNPDYVESESESEAEAEESTESAESSVEESKPYVSPIDFKQLQFENPDIYGWMTIPDTNINYPLLQSPTDDTWYLDHSPNGELEGLGSLYSEHQYNKTDFSDRVLTIYGHHLQNGEMFGTLQAYYSGEDNLKAHQDITIYTPDAELHYKVFAAVPFDKRHLMYYYGFDDDDDVQRFLEDIYSVRAIDAYYDDSVQVTKSDKLLVLSTCLIGDNTQRFLVIAVAEDPVNDSQYEGN